MRVAQLGGRVADKNTVCFCLSWKDTVDLDLYCVLPNGQKCSFNNKKPTSYIALDVDKRANDSGLRVENIFLEAKSCQDGIYKYFVNYYSGHGRSVPFTFVMN